MSPFEKLLEIVEAGFPRVSGDEPPCSDGRRAVTPVFPA